MSKIHVLNSAGNSSYNIVLHTPVIAGNNSVSKSWKSCMLVAGKAGFTTMSEGTGPGQISTAEKATVVSGDVWEIPTTIHVDPNLSGQALINAVTAMCDEIIATYKSRVQREYKFFGYTIE